MPYRYGPLEGRFEYAYVSEWVSPSEIGSIITDTGLCVQRDLLIISEEMFDSSVGKLSGTIGAPEQQSQRGDEVDMVKSDFKVNALNAVCVIKCDNLMRSSVRF